jgi:hypothetical protein
MADNNPYEYPQQPPVQPPYQYPPVKPTSVTVFGVLNCVFGGLGILCAPCSIFGLFIGDLIPANEINPVEIAAGYKIFLIVASVIGIGVAAWLLSLGVGLLQSKSWARRGCVIYGWFAIIWGIIAGGINIAAYSLGWITAPQGQLTGVVGGMCGGFAGLIYPVLLLIFMQSPRVKQYFAG